MQNISKRAKDLPASPIRKLVPYSQSAKKRGIHIYHLNIGQPDIPSPEIFLKQIRSYPFKTVAYEQSDGNEKLKEYLSKYYQSIGGNIDPEDLIITYGASEALLMAFYILLSEGEECLTAEPFYANYDAIAKLAGVKLKTFTTRLENNFTLPPLETITRKVNKKTKAILICNPSNPTGAVYEGKILNNIVDYCVSKKKFLIADETYREFIYEGKKIKSLLSFKKAKDLVVLTDTLSKRFSLCGARIGALVSANKDIISSALKIAQSRTSASSIDQYAATFLDKVPNNYFPKILKEYTKRRKVLIEELGKIPGIKIAKPYGAFYLIAKLPVKNSEDFCRFLLEKYNYKGETVMLSPAEGFYKTRGLGTNQVRIAYVLGEKELIKACFVLKKALESYK